MKWEKEKLKKKKISGYWLNFLQEKKKQNEKIFTWEIDLEKKKRKDGVCRKMKMKEKKQITHEQKKRREEILKVDTVLYFWAKLEQKKMFFFFFAQ